MNSTTETSLPFIDWKQLSEKLGRRFWPLTMDTLYAEARRRTRLDDFGQPALNPAVTVLLNSLEFEADLHRWGVFLSWLICENCSIPDCSLPKLGTNRPK